MHAETVTPGRSAPIPWWKEIDDPALHAWIETALDRSWELARIHARLEQAGALADLAGADRWPALSAEAGARRNRTIVPTGLQAGQVSIANVFSLGLAASYEIDLWGRIAAQNRAAASEVRASREDLETARLTLAAEIAEAWLQARETAGQLELLRRQLDVSTALLDNLEQRFASGQIPWADVLAHRQQRAALEALVPGLEARFAVLRHQLAALAGRMPDEAPAPPAGIPELPPLPAAGTPADLLTNRPDVRAAFERLAAADARAASAVAARLPMLRLSASIGYQADTAASLLDEWIGSAAALAGIPLLDGGRRAAEVRRARAARDEAAATLAATLVRAVREVEDALVQETRQRNTLERLEAQLRWTMAWLEQARARYASGLADYPTVLNALDRVQSLERQMLSARRQAWTHRIQLYRALGGTIAPGPAVEISP